MTTALYINGVYETVLEEIRTTQERDPNKACFLQPYSSSRINLLAKLVPTPASPVRLYMSLTDSLSVVSYRALIVDWKDKRNLSSHELIQLNKHIRTFQPKEKEIYFKAAGGQECVNLISVMQLERLSDPFPVSSLTKINDGTPLKKRTRSGGWSYVEAHPNWVGMLDRTVLGESLEASFRKELAQSLKLSSEARKQRLQKASKLPVAVQAITCVFRRNPDVAAEVLSRANGICERCHSKAPFLRASDGTPYLEVHHRTMLAEGGEDIVENAMAVCPNCHRELHFGQ